MKRGYVTGRKRERHPRQTTLDRLTAMGAAIAQHQQGQSVDELLATPPQEKPPMPRHRARTEDDR